MYDYIYFPYDCVVVPVILFDNANGNIVFFIFIKLFSFFFVGNEGKLNNLFI